MKSLHLSIPISKVDEEQRTVWGYGTVEELDKQGEIVDYEASKKAFADWPGNIREMHDPTRAIGKKIEVSFDDANKGVWVGAKISRSADGDNAWQKIKEGVLTGFSIGGKVINFAKEVTKDASGEREVNRITDYALSELSIVDNPAAPSATLQVVKSMGGKLYEAEVLQRARDPWPEIWWTKYYQIEPKQAIKKRETNLERSNEMSKEKEEVKKDMYGRRSANSSAQEDVEQGQGTQLKERGEMNDASDGGGRGNNAFKPSPARNTEGEDLQSMYDVRATDGEAAQNELRHSTPEHEIAENTALSDPHDGEESSELETLLSRLLELVSRDRSRGYEQRARVMSGGIPKLVNSAPVDFAKAVAAELRKSETTSTDQTDILKAFDDRLTEVETLKSEVKSLKELVEKLSLRPAATTARKGDFVTVDKSVEKTDAETEYATLLKAADEAFLSNSMTMTERQQLMAKLRKAKNAVAR
ncbi:MAG TPA: HK97 family phage prohead protease [Patescibacteria group bacterium]|jgi:HK97 family phage prohead protease|nr:HK97 family phage prohead protease [Patescibacteria group bacterium]